MVIESYGDPFPHFVINQFLSRQEQMGIAREWPMTGWNEENGSFQLKHNLPRLPPTAKKVAHSISIHLLEEITGIKKLFLDPELFGAGLHASPPGGFLNMHLDFNLHPKGWHRRVNVLIYLNEDWSPTWGGALRLGNDDNTCKYIDPIMGRCVIFETNDLSWHGHPHPLECPANRQRRSLALYYYTVDPPPLARPTTKYIKRKKGK